MSGLDKIVAQNVEYDNSVSGMTADNVQEAIDEIGSASITINAKVQYFANLPAAASHSGETYYVEEYSSNAGIDYLSGLYLSNGTSWTFRDDKIVYSLTAFTGTNKILKTNDTNKEIVETLVEIDSNNNVDLKSGGLKDTNVSTAVKLGDSTNTVVNTTNKTLLGSINELNSGKESAFSKNTAFNKNFETSTSNIKMNGSVSVGSLDTVARADHVHASDTNKLSSVSTDTTLTGNGTTGSPLSVVSSSIIETATCSTAGATEAKTATLTNFSLTTGIRFRITFANTNTGVAPTLNINSTGAKPIADENGNAASATYPFLVKAGTTVEFTYDGTNFIYSNKIVKSIVGCDIYSNGRMVQYGNHDHGSDANSWTDTVTFPVAFRDTAYSVIVTSVDPASGQTNINAKSKATSTFAIEASPNYGAGGNQRYVDWFAIGF